MSVSQEPFVENTPDTGPESLPGEEPEQAVFKVAPEAGERASGQGAQESSVEPVPDLIVADTEPVPPIPEPPHAPQSPPAPEPHPAPRRRPPPSIFWPLVLIGAGAMLLLSNLGYVPWSAWSGLWRLWPVLLIALGIDVLVGRRSMGGAILSGLLMVVLIGGAITLVFFAQDIPILSEWSAPAEWQVRHIQAPLNDVNQATIDIEWTSVPGYLYALEDSDNLIEGSIAYSGELLFDVQVRDRRADVRLARVSSGQWAGPFQFFSRRESRWDVGLAPGLPLDLRLDAASGHCDLDLSGLQVAGLYLDVGSGAVDLSLPATSSFDARIVVGSGGLSIEVPRQVGARITLESGSGGFSPDDRFVLVEGDRDEDGVWETENWDTAGYRIDIQIDQGSGRITVR